MLLHGDLWEGLLANLSVVTLLAMVWVQIMPRISRLATLHQSVIFGLVMGLGAIVVMNMPFVASSGSRLDHRFTLIGIAALFGGPVAAFITAAIAATYRIAIGGPATLIGLLGIAIALLVGMASLYMKRGRERTFSDVVLLAAAMPVAIVGGLFVISPNVRATSSLEPTLALATTIFLATFAMGWAILQEERRARDQRRIAESEQRFRRSMEDSAIGMALVGLDGKILEANRAFAQMLDYSIQELQQLTFFELTHPEDLTIGRETVKRALRGEIASYQFEKRYVRKDGTPIWTLLAGSVIRDQHTNEPLYLVSQVEDIDARKKAEAALLEAEGRWSFALESAGQGVWDFDRRAQRTYYSPVWKKIIGYEEHELANDSDLWLSFIHPDDRDGVRAVDEDYKAGLTPYFEAEFRMRHKDGRWIWVRDRGKTLERDSDGSAIRAIGTHTDITLQKEVEERVAASAVALAEEKERLRITLHSIADAVICTDGIGKLTGDGGFSGNCGIMKQMRDPLYRRHRFPADVISYAVWLYFRFPLSLRMVEEMLAVRGIDVSHESIRHWAEKFGREYSNRIRGRAPSRGDKWHMDEVVVSIGGRKHWLWRAVDQHGFVLDVLVQKRRDRDAAQRFLRKLLKKLAKAPRVMITDKLKSYGAARKDMGLGIEHRQHKGLNNRAENSHQPTRRRERIMKRFKSQRQAQKFLSVHDQVANLFHFPRNKLSAIDYRSARTKAFSAWSEIAAAPLAA